MSHFKPAPVLTTLALSFALTACGDDSHSSNPPPLFEIPLSSETSCDASIADANRPQTTLVDVYPTPPYASTDNMYAAGPCVNNDGNVVIDGSVVTSCTSNDQSLHSTLALDPNNDNVTQVFFEARQGIVTVENYDFVAPSVLFEMSQATRDYCNGIHGIPERFPGQTLDL